MSCTHSPDRRPPKIARKKLALNERVAVTARDLARFRIRVFTMAPWSGCHGFMRGRTDCHNAGAWFRCDKTRCQSKPGLARCKPSQLRPLPSLQWRASTGYLPPMKSPNPPSDPSPWRSARSGDPGTWCREHRVRGRVDRQRRHLGEIKRSLQGDSRFSEEPRLVVLADPCGKAWLSASAEDWVFHPAYWVRPSRVWCSARSGRCVVECTVASCRTTRTNMT
jgi:hypothetical protein